MSLEGYILAPEESGVSKEADELDAVRSWMTSMRIEEMAKTAGAGRRLGKIADVAPPGETIKTTEE